MLSFVQRPGGARSTAVCLLAWLLSTGVILPAGVSNAAADGDSAPEAARRIVVLAGNAGDPRLALVEEAVAFWNGVAGELGVGEAFAAPELVTPRSGLRPFENWAHQLSQLAGRLHASAPGPAPPEAVRGLKADVVMLLSTQSLMPFAWPFDDDGRHFVAIADPEEVHGAEDDEAEDDGEDREGAREHAVRNVIAHELGHVLGLEHSSEPGVLMCLPCDAWADPGPGEARFRPLTDADRDRLRSAASRPQ